MDPVEKLIIGIEVLSAFEQKGGIRDVGKGPFTEAVKLDVHEQSPLKSLRVAKLRSYKVTGLVLHIILT